MRNAIVNKFNQHGSSDAECILEEIPMQLRREVSSYLHRDILARVPFFSGLKDAGLLTSLSVYLKSHIFQPREYVIRRGELGADMFFINRGRVEVWTGHGISYAPM